MDNITIQARNFENAKEELKNFADEIPSSLDLPTVDTAAGLFGWFDYKVTGEELNKLTNILTGHFININSYLISTIKEFGQVYNTFDALDKEYIQNILLAINAAQKASEQAKEAAYKAEKNSSDIIETIDVLKQTINTLANFKNQIDNYKHLKNIDDIWSDNQKIKKDIDLINKKLIKQDEKHNHDSKQHEEFINNLHKFTDDNENYETYIHKLTKKMKISYIFASASLGVAIINIVLFVINLL